MSEKDRLPAMVERESTRPESSERCERPPTRSSMVRTTKSASSATLAAGERPTKGGFRGHPGRGGPTAADQRGRRYGLHGGGQDRGARTVVAGQADRAGVDEVLVEAQEVLHVGAAEGVDGLVGVADRAQVAVGRAEQAQQLVLDLVDVLVLVHEDPLPLLAVLLGQGRLVPQQLDRQLD